MWPHIYMYMTVKRHWKLKKTGNGSDGGRDIEIDTGI